MKNLILLALIIISVCFTGCELEQSEDVTIYINLEKCISCGACEDVCPFDAIKLTGLYNKPVIDPNKCKQCLKCVDICPEEAITGGGQ